MKRRKMMRRMIKVLQQLLTKSQIDLSFSSQLCYKACVDVFQMESF